MLSQGSEVGNIIFKFDLHKNLRALLEQDLSNKVTNKPKKDKNTYFFGDNK